MGIIRSESSENSRVGTAITFLLIGLGAGALAGLLLAPKSGKNLRRDISRSYDDAVDWAGDMKEKVRDAGDRVRDAASRGANMASDIADGVRDRVEPLRRAINRG